MDGFWIIWVVLFAVCIVVLTVASRKMRAANADLQARRDKLGVVAYLSNMWVTPTELLVGDARYPLTGVRAAVEDSGTVNRRFTLTRLATLGVAAVAIPKKLDDRDVYVTVEGPGVAEVRVLHVKQNPNAGAVARQFATKLNATAMQLEKGST